MTQDRQKRMEDMRAQIHRLRDAAEDAAPLARQELLQQVDKVSADLKVLEVADRYEAIIAERIQDAIKPWIRRCEAADRRVEDAERQLHAALEESDWERMQLVRELKKENHRLRDALDSISLKVQKLPPRRKRWLW